jgi:hypothetical protein
MSAATSFAREGEQAPEDTMSRLRPASPTLRPAAPPELRRVGHDARSGTHTILATTNEEPDEPGGGSARTGTLLERLNEASPDRKPARFIALQKWEGYVREVGERTFIARLVPLSGEAPEQEAEIYLEQVDEGDHALIAPGAVFYWSIGYSYRPSGKSTVSSIRFRRLPIWTKREQERAHYWARRFESLFEDE